MPWILLGLAVLALFGSKSASSGGGSGGAPGQTGMGAPEFYTDSRKKRWAVRQSSSPDGSFGAFTATSADYPAAHLVSSTRDGIVIQIETLASNVGASGGGTNTTIPSIPGLDPSAIPDVSLRCGPYPPSAGGYRPICVDVHLPAGSTLLPGESVEATLQEGRRPLSDDSEMAHVLLTVVSGDPLRGYELLYAGTPPIQTQNLTKALPPAGTVFHQVLPTFILRKSSASVIPSGGDFGLPDLIPPGFGSMGTPTGPTTPPKVPTPPDLPPIPGLPTTSEGLSQNGSESPRNGVSAIAGYDAVYGFSLDPEGSKAPSGVQLVLLTTETAQGKRVILAIRAIGGDWAFYFLGYVIESVTKAPPLAYVNSATVSLRDSATIEGLEQVLPAIEGPSIMGSDVTGGSGPTASRSLLVVLADSLEQVEFASVDAPTAERRQVMSLRQLADWLL